MKRVRKKVVYAKQLYHNGEAKKRKEEGWSGREIAKGGKWVTVTGRGVPGGKKNTLTLEFPEEKQRESMWFKGGTDVVEAVARWG